MATPAPALIELTLHAPALPCPYCGWIESKHEILSSFVEPGTYEYTLRMADGSSSVFRETLPITWRLGERLTLIAGANTPLH